MTYVSSLLSLTAVYMAVLASPGPNFFILSQLSLDGRRREARWTVFGLSTGSIVWVISSLLGLSALFASHPQAATTVRLLGAAYLFWYGTKLLRAALAPARTETSDASSRTSAMSPLAAYRVGLMTGLTNPKGAAFWTSAFAALLPHGAPLWFYATTVVVVGVLSLSWHIGIILVFGVPVLRSQYLQFEHAINGVAGGALVLLGIQRATSQ